MSNKSDTESIKTSGTTEGNKVKMEAHQLPKECYPPTDSDDDSFEVLETNSNPGDQHKAELDLQHEVSTQLISCEDVDQALQMAQESMMTAMTLQSLPQKPLLQMHDSVMSTSSSSSSIESKLYLELNEKVRTLQEENTTLKTTIMQQSIVTKNNSEILNIWTEDVIRVQESHKQKFDKMKAFNLQLKKENEQLKQILAASAETPGTKTNDSQTSDSLALIQEHKKQLKELQEEHTKDLQTKCEEIMVVKTELEETVIKLAHTSLELQRVEEELNKQLQQSMIIVQQEKDKKNAEQEQFEQLIAEKEGQHNKIIGFLQEEKNVAERQIQELKDTHTDGIKKMEEKHQLEISALQQQITGNQIQTQEQLTCLLKRTKDDLKAVTDECLATKELNEQQALRIKDLKGKLAQLSDIHDTLSGEFVKTKSELADNSFALAKNSDEMLQLQQQLESNNREIVALKAKVEGKIYLEEQLADYKKQLQANDNDYKRMLLEYEGSEKRVQELQKEIMLLKVRLIKIQNEETAELQRLRIQLSEAQNNIVRIKEAKKLAEHEAEKNRNAVEEMDRKCKAAFYDKDKLVALEEQLKVYQADFKSQCESKILVVEELNRVAHDLEGVHKRNRQLTEEIERLRTAETVIKLQPQTSSTENNSPPPLYFSCPLCNDKFRSLKQVQEHVEECLIAPMSS